MSADFSKIEDLIPFHKHMGIKVDHLEKGYVRLRLPFKEEFIGNYVSGFYHGGILAALMDAVAGIAAGIQVFPEIGMDRLSTIDMRVDYMKPVKGKDILAHGRVRKAGKRSIFVAMNITYMDDEESLVEGRAVLNIR